jgi:hypothetical protein
MYLATLDLGDVEAQLEQFAMDPWRALERALAAQLSDQRSKVRVDPRSPSSRTRLPKPIEAESSPMPSDQSLWLDQDQGAQNRRKPTIELNEEPAIAIGQGDSTFDLAS